MKSNSGFTLIETIIYTAIIGTVIVSFTGFSLSITSLKNKNFVMQETQANSRTAMNIVSAYIKKAESVITPNKGLVSNFLILDMPNSDENVTIELIDGIIYLKNGNNEPDALVSNLINASNLQFENYSQDNSIDNIKISFEVNYRYNESKEFNFSFPVSTAVSIRK